MVGEVDLSAELEGRSSVPCAIRSHSRHSTWLTTPCPGKTARIWPQNSSTNRCVRHLTTPPVTGRQVRSLFSTQRRRDAKTQRERASVNDGVISLRHSTPAPPRARE